MSFLQQNNMKKIIATITENIGNLVNRVGNSAIHYERPSLTSYAHKKTLRSQSNTSQVFTGIYEKTGKKYFVKSYQFLLRNYRYNQLKNEAKALQMYAQITKKSPVAFSAPQFVELIKDKKRITLVTEYIEGKTLEHLTHKEQDIFTSQFLTQVTKYNLLSKTDINSLSQVTIRTAKRIIPIYFLFAVIRNPKSIKCILFLLRVYLSRSPMTLETKQTLVHSDLNFDNFLVQNNTLFLIDPELACISDRELDIANLFINAHVTNPQTKDMSQLLSAQLLSQTEVQKFILYSIYTMLKTYVYLNSTHIDITTTNTYIQIAFKTYLDKLAVPSLTFAELAHKSVLVFLSKLNLFNLYLLTLFNKQTLILCYHSISADGWRFATTPEEFKKQMRFISKRTPISLSEVFNKGVKNGIVVTFDDGYEDFLINALPILKKYNIPATMFVLGNPEKANHSELQNTKKMLSTSQIKSLHKQGVEIGFHTATHSDMRKMSDAELEYEIKTSKENLEKKLGFKLRYFAYPRGIYDKRIITTVKEAGFEKAFTVNGGTVWKNSDDFLINRISIEGTVTFNQFIAMISPLGILFETFYMGVLKLKEAIVFRLRKNQLKLKGAV